MNDSRFLVARVLPESMDGGVDWLGADEPPYQPMDPVDFVVSPEIGEIYALYQSQYSLLDEALNVPMPEALLEYNRWVVVVDESDRVLGFACYKTTEHGLKLGLTASDGSARSRTAVKAILRLGLDLPGVYAEVSGAVENVVTGHVPELSPALAERVLEKPVEQDADGRHYHREITNVGLKTKLLVGHPILED